VENRCILLLSCLLYLFFPGDGRPPCGSAGNTAIRLRVRLSLSLARRSLAASEPVQLYPSVVTGTLGRHTVCLGVTVCRGCTVAAVRRRCHYAAVKAYRLLWYTAVRRFASGQLSRRHP